jgi:pentose-5-phosphate-3-epimerase
MAEEQNFSFIHLQASSHLYKDITLIKVFRKKAGISLKSETLIHLMSDSLMQLDFILLMTLILAREARNSSLSAVPRHPKLRAVREAKALKSWFGLRGGIKLEIWERLVGMG